MRNLALVTLVLIVMALVGCASVATPTPITTATPDNSTPAFGIATSGTPKLEGTTWSFDSTDSQGDQVEFRVETTALSSLSFTADVVMEENAGGYLAFIFDTPQIRKIYFGGNGAVQISVPGRRPSEMILEAFQLGAKAQLNVFIDLERASWTIIIVKDGRTTVDYTGPFDANSVESIRISTPVISSPPPVKATVSNIRLQQGRR